MKKIIENSKLFIILTIQLICTSCVLAAHQHLEKEYQSVWCNAHKGVMEYKLPDKARVDCLTDTLAVEFDFAPKWAECIGQAIYYGKKTNKTPACVLIMEDPDKDKVYLKRLKYTVRTKFKKQPSFRFKIYTMKAEDIK